MMAKWGNGKPVIALGSDMIAFQKKPLLKVSMLHIKNRL
jgi:hypothetical protein